MSGLLNVAHKPFDIFVFFLLLILSNGIRVRVKITFLGVCFIVKLQ